MDASQSHGPRIDVIRDGPYRVSGGLPLREQWTVIDENGDSVAYRDGPAFDVPAEYELCRCGRSATAPFCDQAHCRVGFDGTETARRTPYLDRARRFEGPEMDVTDATYLCASARFCHPAGGIWNLVEQTDDPEARRLVVREAGHCPSGRLVAWARATGRAVEPDFAPSLALVEDTAAEVRGPIRVMGGVPVLSSDGETYEIRNRMTLCRCGRSRDKPFCDSSHLAR